MLKIINQSINIKWPVVHGCSYSHVNFSNARVLYFHSIKCNRMANEYAKSINLNTICNWK